MRLLFSLVSGLALINTAFAWDVLQTTLYGYRCFEFKGGIVVMQPCRSESSGQRITVRKWGPSPSGLFYGVISAPVKGVDQCMYADGFTLKYAKCSGNDNDAAKKHFAWEIFPISEGLFQWRNHWYDRHCVTEDGGSGAARLADCNASIHGQQLNWFDMEPVNGRQWKGPKGVLDIIYPGAHNAGTETLTLAFRTQKLNIRQLLENGVRLFDIDTCFKGTVTYVCHTNMEKSHKLLDVLNDISSFLKDHPTEVVMIRASDFNEDDKTKLATAFVEDFKRAFPENMRITSANILGGAQLRQMVRYRQQVFMTLPALDNYANAGLYNVPGVVKFDSDDGASIQSTWYSTPREDEWKSESYRICMNSPLKRAILDYYSQLAGFPYPDLTKQIGNTQLKIAASGCRSRGKKIVGVLMDFIDRKQVDAIENLQAP